MTNPPLTFTAIDFETATGYRNSVCQVGLVKAINGIIAEEYCGLIQPPGNYIWEDFSEIHGIYPEHTACAPRFAESYPKWKHFIENQTLVAHNMRFDFGCLKACLADFCGIGISAADETGILCKTYCTMKIWKGAFQNAKLLTCCENNRISLECHHNALADAKACAKLFIIAVNLNRDLKETY
ncbi:MAG: hypothetical protein LBG87_00945 [Spirochaetaceae bacterium]|nr:hypothetical protein [Spirochaetaceae bacterium]